MKLQRLNEIQNSFGLYYKFHLHHSPTYPHSYTQGLNTFDRKVNQPNKEKKMANKTLVSHFDLIILVSSSRRQRKVAIRVVAEVWNATKKKEKIKKRGKAYRGIMVKQNIYK